MKNTLLLIISFSFFGIKLTLAQCGNLNISTNTILNSCFSSCDGFVSVDVTGGSGVFAYNFTSANYVPLGNQNGSNQVTDLCPGTYYVIVTDDINSCSDTVEFWMYGPPPLNVQSMNVTNVNCTDTCNNIMTAIGTGGVQPYTYIWNTGANTQSIANLCPGLYTVQIIDAMGCQTAVTSQVVNTNPILVQTIGGTPPIDCSSCNGNVWTLVNGGVPPYFYTWSNGVTGEPQIGNLCAGNYSVTVLDANGCTQSQSITLQNTAAFGLSVNSNNSVCGGCTGSAIAVVDGNPQFPLTFMIDGVIVPDSIFTNLCPGTFDLVVQDASGCIQSTWVNISTTPISGLNVTATTHNESSTGIADGYIFLNSSGTTDILSYTWSNGATTDSIYSLTAGTYTVSVSNSNGECNIFTYVIETGPDYGFIHGYFYNDSNNNCLYDIGIDQPLINYLVSAVNTGSSGTYYGITNNQGFYSIYAPASTYQVFAANTTYQNNNCTNTYDITLSGGTYPQMLNMAYDIFSAYKVCTNVWIWGTVPGFNGNCSVSVTNNGFMTAEGTVCLTLPSPLNYINASPAPSSISGNVICFNYSNLVANQSQVFQIQFNTPVGTALGTSLQNCATATISNGVATDSACLSNCINTIVFGSFDPNDKSVSPSGLGANGAIALTEDEFSYLIRFQNTGTGPAVNVYVMDTLSDLLDPLSLTMLACSHNYTLEFLGDHIVRWMFSNIMLPDSGANEAESHGYIYFRIKKISTPQIGEVISNSASIYFDFNEPVHTNTVVNTYTNFTAVQDASGANIIIAPNPATDNIYLLNNRADAYQIILYDVLGRIVMQQQISGTSNSISIALLPRGFYQYRYLGSDGSISHGKLMITR